MMILLGLSYYLRGRIGAARWRRLHRFTALAWVLGVVHSLGEGSDAGAAWFLLLTFAVVAPAAGLLVARLLPPARPAPLARGS
jgi:sulfoxide reductase heme-binding subunit YedZ